MKHYVLVLTAKEIDLARAVLALANDSGDLGDTEGVEDLAFAVLAKIDAAKPTTERPLLLTKSEARAIEKAADNTMNDPHWWRDWYTVTERRHAKSGMTKLGKFSR